MQVLLVQGKLQVGRLSLRPDEKYVTASRYLESFGFAVKNQECFTSPISDYLIMDASTRT
jgi:hypothetical protein